MSKTKLGKRCSCAVVFDRHRAPQDRTQLALHWHAFETGNVWQAPATSGRVDLTWDREANRLGLGIEFSDRVCDVLQQRYGFFRFVCGDRTRIDGLAVFDVRNLDTRPAKINTNHGVQYGESLT